VEKGEGKGKPSVYRFDDEDFRGRGRRQGLSLKKKRLVAPQIKREARSTGSWEEKRTRRGKSSRSSDEADFDKEAASSKERGGEGGGSRGLSSCGMTKKKKEGGLSTWTVTGRRGRKKRGGGVLRFFHCSFRYSRKGAGGDGTHGMTKGGRERKRDDLFRRSLAPRKFKS